MQDDLFGREFQICEEAFGEQSKAQTIDIAGAHATVIAGEVIGSACEGMRHKESQAVPLRASPTGRAAYARATCVRRVARPLLRVRGSKRRTSRRLRLAAKSSGGCP